MKPFDPEAMSAAFAAASAGYSKTKAADLPKLFLSLPAPTSKREWAITNAIRVGIEDPGKWDRVHAPYLCQRRPGFGLPEWRELK